MIERKEDYRLTVYPIDDEEDRPVTDYIAEAITEQWGERCLDFDEGCACCQVWARYDRLTALEQDNKRLREALERSVTAIEDWLNIYAEEHCDEARVEEAKCRVYEHGTLAYIADVQQQNRSALTHEDKT